MSQAENRSVDAAIEDDLTSLLRESARNFRERALPHERLRALRADSKTFDRAQWAQMAELGWAQMLVPQSRGGLELDMSAVAAVCCEMGAAVAPEPLIETAVGTATILNYRVTDDADLPALDGAEHIIVPALGATGDSAFATVAARHDPGTFTLDGSCSNVPLGADADGWIVPATCGGEPAWFYIDRGAVGATAEPHELADGGRDATLRFEQVNGTLIVSGAQAMSAQKAARHRVEFASSAYLLGLSETLFQITLDYLATRRQFGQAIGSFQAIQHRMVDLYLQNRLTAAVIDAVGPAFVRPESDAAARAASRARYRACTTALAMTREAIQLHGAIGTTDECDVGLFANRALVMTARYGQAATHVARLADIAVGAPAAPALTPVDADVVPADGDWNAFDNDTFRAIVRQWLETNYPPTLRNPSSRLHWNECRDWYAQLYERGWAAPAWPAEHGGMGLKPDKLLIFIEERERHGVARTPDQGIIMIGPLLMQHGSPSQQQYYLPHALSGEHIWCQGYSEPNAGSDLASLATSAVRDGDEFVINGQKIWTTMAHDATHMFCLVRTDPAAKPQAGISFVLIDLEVDGITIRPIRNIAGDAEFCEVFFDDVRIPVDSLVGNLNDGWTIAKALLSFERLFIGSPKQCQHGLSRLYEIADPTGLRENPVFLDRLTRFEIDVADLESLYTEFADALRRGETLGADVSLLKIWASETVCRLSEFILESAGPAGGQRGAIRFGEVANDVLSHYYNARPTPIYGGSNEIQRNILAKHVLGMPSH